MPDAFNNPAGASPDDELDFRPLASSSKPPVQSRPARGASLSPAARGMYGDDIDFQPHTPPLNFDTLHQPASSPIGASAGIAPLTLAPPKYPVPPKPTGLESLSSKSKPGDEIGLNGTRYRFDGLNWNPVGRAAPIERAPEVTGALNPKPFTVRLAESMTEPGTFLGDAVRESGAVPGTGPDGHTSSLDLRGTTRAPHSLTEALALGAGETPRQAQATGTAAQKPLVDVGTASAANNPVSRGLSRFASGLSSPENLGLVGLSAGFDALPAAISKIASGIFGYQMGKGLYESYAPFKEAVDRGDWNLAVEIGSQAVPQAAMTFTAGAHALRGTTGAIRTGAGELARRTGATGGLLEEIGREPQPGVTLDPSKAAWEPVTRGQTVEDLNAQRARGVQANAAAARGMANLEGRLALKMPPLTRPMLPAFRPEPEETISGQPVQTRIYPSDQAPLITPQPARTPEGAIITPSSPISSRPQLPAAGATPPTEEENFLGGKPSQFPRMPPVPRGVIETYAPDYRPQFSEALPATQTGNPSEIDFRPGETARPARQTKAQIHAAETESRIRAGLQRTIDDENQSQNVRDMARTELERRQGHQASVPKQQAQPKFTVTPAPIAEPAQLTKAEASPYQRQQAQLATNRLRNPVEREYAQSYLRARLEGGMAPEPISSLSPQRAQIISEKVEEFLGKEEPKKVSERFTPDVVSEAENELRSAAELAGSFDKPGRYMTEADHASAEFPDSHPTWYGVTSSREHVAGQFPWYADEEITPGKLETAIRRGAGADYERIVGKIAEGIHAERESARPVIEEYGPHLRELANQVRGVDPDLAQNMLDLADGKAVGFRNLREYIEEKIHDAEGAALFSNAVDEAANAAAGSSRAAEPDGLGSEARTREGVLPGLEEAVTENQRAAGQYQADQLTEQINRPADSIDFVAGKMERNSPLFRGTEASPQRELLDENAPEKATKKPSPQEGSGGTLYAGIDPSRVRAAVHVLSDAWQNKIARPFIDRVLRIGDKYRQARAADPAVAEGLHLLDNAPQYLRQKAGQIVHDIVGDLSREQERLFVLMADADSRENLRTNHPQEFREAQNDRAVQDALRKYRPIERELSATRERLGGETLEGDYLRRVYDKYVAGVGKEQAPSSIERGTSAYDRVIRPQRIGTMSREATAEYYHQNGLHEFGPAFATKFIGTNLRALRDTVAKEFLSKATQLEPGAPEPRSIQYNDERYYRPDLAADMPKGTKVYDRYDPTAGEKFPQAADGKFLGPREIVRALNDFGRREDSEPGAVRRFFQEQIIGFGFGMPHVANIMRRVTQGAPGGALNPKGWLDAWRVAFGKELRERGIKGLDDPTFDTLAQHGAITTGEMSNLKQYIGGNLNPANWARAMAGVGHRILFEPGSAGGLGGIDQRARIYVADLVRSQRPELSDTQVAQAVRDQLGDYNRANWTDQQKLVSKFMMFPGWDASSIRWVIQHPIKTTVPPAILTLLANHVLHQLGQNRAEDQSDIDTIHVGDRAYGTGLLRESVARNLFRPFINYANAKAQGTNEQRAEAAAARGVTSGAGGLLGMLRPDLSGFIALAANRQNLFGGKELVSKDDYDTPGNILPTRALEKQAVFTVRHALPALDRMLDSDQDLDLKAFAGGNLGASNYRDDVERRLSRNTAEAEQTYLTVSRLAKSDPARAREYIRDPENAAYALFHRDFAQITAALRRLDQTREHVDSSGLSAEDKQNRLRHLDTARATLLGHAETLNKVLFERRQQAPQMPPPAAGVRPAPAPSSP